MTKTKTKNHFFPPNTTGDTETVPAVAPTVVSEVPLRYTKSGALYKVQKVGAVLPNGTVVQSKKLVKNKEKQYNEKGQLLTSKGEIDKRPELLKKNREKSTVYQAIKKAKESKQNSKVLEIEDSDSESSEEEDDEYHIEEIVVKKKNEPQVLEVEKIVEKVVEVEKPDVESKKIAKKLKEENAKIKEQFNFHNHLQTIDNMTRKMKCNF